LNAKPKGGVDIVSSSWNADEENKERKKWRGGRGAKG